MPKLTKKLVDASEPAADRYCLWDTEERGLGVLVYPSGVKSLVFQYETLPGRSRRLTIGRVGDLTLDEARARAKKFRVQVRDGADPAAARAADRSAGSLNDLFDRYLADHVEPRNAASTAADVRRLLNSHLRPQLGTIAIQAVTRADVARMHAAMRKTPRRANLALAVLSKALSLAELWGLRPEHSNPVRGIQRYAEEHRTRFLKPDELARVGAALREAETEGLPWRVDETRASSKHVPKENRRTPVAWQAVAAIHLLLLSGARRSEILSLEWSHVDRRAGTLSLPDKKGRKRVPHPVGRRVLDVLNDLPRARGARWVLPREEDPTRHLASEVLTSAWQRVRWRAGLEDVHLHDLRHTVGTFAAQTGANAFIVRDLLRHQDIKTSAIYANFDADPVRSISDAVGDRISSLMDAAPPAKRGSSRKRS